MSLIFLAFCDLKFNGKISFSISGEELDKSGCISYTYIKKIPFSCGNTKRKKFMENFSLTKEIAEEYMKKFRVE